MGTSCHGASPSEFGRSGSAVPAPVPEAITTEAPGAELDSMLSQVNVAEVSGYDSVEVMKAWSRQMSRVRAEFLRAILETGMRRPGSADTVARVTEPGEFASEEARAAFVWSRRRARDTFEFAHDVHERLPMIGEAMLAGDVDEYRAAALAQWTRDLESVHAEYICKQLMPRAGEMTVGALIHEIKRLAIALDPEWAERRYRAAVAQRRVVGERHGDGTATVSGAHLPVERAKAGCDRIDALAQSCKAAGDRRPVDHIRADLFMGMIDGTFTGLSEAEIVRYVLDHPLVPGVEGSQPEAERNRAPTDGESGERRENGEDGESGERRENGESGEGGRNDGGPEQPGGPGSSGGQPGGNSGPGGKGGDGSASPARPASEGGQGGSAASSTSSPGRGAERPESAAFSSGRQVRSAAGGNSPSSPAVEGGAMPPGAVGALACWGVRELRIELTTLLGYDERPAEIPPWGYVSAGLGREIIAGMGQAEWRFVVCDDDGRPICSGITTARPEALCHSAGGPRGGRRRSQVGSGVVELQVRASDLSWLDAACAENDAEPEWSVVIADIAARLNVGNVDTDAAPAEARRRAPGAGLRRLVQVRARYCTHPACTTPAVNCDQDHGAEYAEGGVTTAGNLHPPCRHDHRLRHDGGWQVAIEADGATVWTSALGHTYATRPPPVIKPSPAPWDTVTVFEPDEPEHRTSLSEHGRNRRELLDDSEPPF